MSFFIIGEPVNGNNVNCDVKETENQIDICVSTPESGIAFTDDVRMLLEGSVLNITLRRVMVSPLFSSGSRIISIEKAGLTEIYLGGKLIWTAK